MIIRKKMESKKRSASAWIGSDGIYFGVTDHCLGLGEIKEDKNGNVTIFIYKNDCKEANVKIKFMDI